MAWGNEDDQESGRMSLEVALEIKSLRRIISAYLNYPDAAEHDVQRYERSFRRLPPSHKALLAHLPLKYQNLRWCISQNSYFIFEMLKAFEPPLNLNQDIDIDEDERPSNWPSTGGINAGTSEHASTSTVVSKADRDGHNYCSMEKRAEGLNECSARSCSRGAGSHAEDSCSNNQENFSSDVGCNGHVCSSDPEWLDPSLMLHVPLVDVDKVRCIIRNIVRDWANEGQSERDQCYKPILEELNGIFPDRSKESPPTCLVPGAGLGRLALEISCIGFICQGNEFSYYMMICSNFILNHCRTANEWTIYPWIHNSCNLLSDSDQLRPASIPDIHPASAGTTEGFSMCGGDFVEVYSDPNQEGAWDSVVTCFFLDTAHNIVEYIQIISRILKEGGVWINLGPLLYHFADMYGQEDEMSIELSLEDVKNVALHYGFELEKCSTIETTYTTNPRSMMQNRYYAAFWTMRKKKTATKKEGSSMDLRESFK